MSKEHIRLEKYSEYEKAYWSNFENTYTFFLTNLQICKEFDL